MSVLTPPATSHSATDARLALSRLASTSAALGELLDADAAVLPPAVLGALAEVLCELADRLEGAVEDVAGVA